jgi:hypothetical protein
VATGDIPEGREVMVEVAFTRPSAYGPQEFARLRAMPGQHIVPVFGDISFVVGFAPYSPQYGRTIAATEDPVAWARALPAAYVQQPNADATIVVDGPWPPAQAAPMQPAWPAQQPYEPGRQLRGHAVFWWLAISCGLMVIGGFAPWATALGALDVSGTVGDGWFLILGGLAGGGLCLQLALGERNPRAVWQYIVILIVAVIGFLVAVVDAADISSGGAFVQPGWGLWLSLLAAFSAGVAAITAMAVKPARAPWMR